MGTLKHIMDVSCKTSEEAVELIKNGVTSVVLYNSNQNKLDQELSRLYNTIKQMNSKNVCIEDQILPCYPYYWMDINGCLSVYCAEISWGKFDQMAEMATPFAEKNYSVLSNESARKPMSKQAMASMAAIGHMFGRL